VPAESGMGAAFKMLTPLDGVRADHDEVRLNRRARSARMRILQSCCRVGAL